MLNYLTYGKDSPWAGWMETNIANNKIRLPTSFWSSVNIEREKNERKSLVKEIIIVLYVRVLYVRVLTHELK